MRRGLLLAHSCPDGLRAWVTLGLDPSQTGASTMPSTPNRSKKALQEIARVFNKLASGLTADLNQAIREIERLRREVQKLKTSSGTRTNRPSSNAHRKTSNRTPRFQKSETESHTPAHTAHSETHQETHHQAPKPAHEGSPFVFPREPFNPPSPPEPAPSGNN